MAKTLFEKIIDREIPGDIVHEDAHCVAFRDINPGAPMHILLVPRKPMPRLCDATTEAAARPSDADSLEDRRRRRLRRRLSTGRQQPGRAWPCTPSAAAP